MNASIDPITGNKCISASGGACLCPSGCGNCIGSITLPAFEATLSGYAWNPTRLIGPADDTTTEAVAFINAINGTHSMTPVLVPIALEAVRCMVFHEWASGPLYDADNDWWYHFRVEGEVEPAILEVRLLVYSQRAEPASDEFTGAGTRSSKYIPVNGNNCSWRNWSHTAPIDCEDIQGNYASGSVVGNVATQFDISGATIGT